jgi:cytochrome b pre-mRNA-processing protein 3
MVLRHLRTLPDGAGLSQALFDHFCADMDANLREMGVGDLAVPKRMQTFGEAFYGRSAAYDLALTDSHEALAQAIGRNILEGRASENARSLAAYTEAALARLSALDDAALLAGMWAFPPPSERNTQP